MRCASRLRTSSRKKDAGLCWSTWRICLKKHARSCVSMPKSKISQHERLWLDLPWQKVRESVDVKLYMHDNELYVLAKSEGRQQKEIAIRRRRLVSLLLKLRAMRRSLPSRDQLLIRI